MRLVRLAWLCACLVFVSSFPVSAAASKEEVADAVRERIISQLDLTAKQKTAIEESRTKRDKTLGELFARITTLRQRIQEEFKKPLLEKEQVRALHQETKELMARIMDIHFESLMEVRELLEPAQHAKMIDLFEKIGKDLPSPDFPGQPGAQEAEGK